MQLAILNQGTMAQAYAECFLKRDLALTEKSESADLILISAFSGHDTYRLLEKARFRSGAVIVDLTTQSLPELSRLQDFCFTRSYAYYAGGVTGGAEQVGETGFNLLLGPAGIPEEVLTVLAALGSVQEFATAEQAVAAKLLHNLYLIILAHAQGAVLELAEAHEIPAIWDVLDMGTAGRKPSAGSVVRDSRDLPKSSYLSGLVSKDLEALKQSFPYLPFNPFFNLKEMQSLHQPHGMQAFTKTISDFWKDSNEFGRTLETRQCSES